MRKDIEYINSLKKYILIMTGLFFLSFISGLVVSENNPGLSENYLEMFKDSFGWIRSLPPLAVMFLIFLNNALKSLIALVLGVGFGIFPLLFVSGNGLIIGILAHLVSKQQGTLFVLAALIPHGIIEVPMILISAGIGLRLGYISFLYLMGEKTDIKLELGEGVRFYMRVIVPLLFAAAMIETFVTPFIAMKFIF